MRALADKILDVAKVAVPIVLLVCCIIVGFASIKKSEINVTTYTCNVNELYYAPLQLTVIKNEGKEAVLVRYRKFAAKDNKNNTEIIQCEPTNNWSYPNE